MRALGWFEPKPMYLGLDLRGGVHFLLEVDMQGALTGRYDSLANDIRSSLRDARISVSGVERSDHSIVARFDTEQSRNDAQSELRTRMPDMTFTTGTSGDRSEEHTSELQSLK